MTDKFLFKTERDTTHDDILIIETPEIHTKEEIKQLQSHYGDDRHKDTQNFNSAE